MGPAGAGAGVVLCGGAGVAGAVWAGGGGGLVGNRVGKGLGVVEQAATNAKGASARTVGAKTGSDGKRNRIGRSLGSVEPGLNRNRLRHIDLRRPVPYIRALL